MPVKSQPKRDYVCILAHLLYGKFFCKYIHNIMKAFVQWILRGFVINVTFKRLNTVQNEEHMPISLCLDKTQISALPWLCPLYFKLYSQFSVDLNWHFKPISNSILAILCSLVLTILGSCQHFNITKECKN